LAGYKGVRATKNHMKKIKLLFIFTTLVSCSSSDNNDSNIIGTWQTGACEQSSDSQGNLINTWSKGIYQFTESGTLKFRPEPYLDSGCITLNKAVSLENIEPAAVFQNLGNETLQEGISGNRVVISFTDPSANITVEAFYTINNNVLCFSSAYSFEPNRLGIFPSSVPDIDFTKCLTPYTQP